MFRKLIVPMLATAMLGGCATDYNYRGGNGDYYYGQPRVEYRYQGYGGFNDGYYGRNGYYGGVGFGYGYGSGSFGYGSRAYYDPFGRLVYGYPGLYRYGNGWYQQRPLTHREHDRRDHGGRDHDGHEGHTRNDDVDRDRDGDPRHDRRPPWRNLGDLQGRDGDNVSREDEDRQSRMRRVRSTTYPITVPRVQPQRSALGAPLGVGPRSEPLPRMSGALQGTRRGKSTPPVISDE